MRSRRRFPRPHTPRGWIVSAAAGAAVAAIATFAAVYLLLFRGSAAAPLTLSPSAATPGPSLATDQVPGTWKVGSGSVAGYRVRETLLFAAAPDDAVGRTSSISGTMTVSGTPSSLMVTAARFTVDVSTLTSDQSMRDDHVRSQWLDSNTYPKATFVLSSPLSLPSTALSGTPFTVSTGGQMTIHGVTRAVTIPISARLSGSTIELAGSTSFPFEQFGMSVPNVAGFVSVQDHATMEFDLHMSHA